MVYLLLLLGLVLIVFGGDLFVRAAVGLAEALRLPHIVIGATFMSLATTTPEIVVSIASGLRGAPDLALGNAIGSILCNFGLIAGAIGLVRVTGLHARQMAVPLGIFAGISVVALLMSINGAIGRLEAGGLLAAGGAYFVLDLIRNLRQRTPAVERAAETLEAEVHPPKSPFVSSLLFVLGAGLVVGGSRLLVDSAVEIATALGVPPIIIGLTVVAVGTSLPELVTAVASARRNVGELSVGNLIGANIANWTLVAGSAGVLSPIPVRNEDLLVSFPALFLMLALVAYLALRRRRLDPRASVALLGLYAVYLAVLLLRTI
jgi:cation:H+ antiporter